MKILIVGCGWVGEEVAKRCLNKGWKVFATCTSEEKRNYLVALGLNVAVVDFDSEDTISGFPDAFDFVLNSIPASSKSTLNEVTNRFKNVLKYLHSLTYEKLIYLSSIGIYPDKNEVYTEEYTEDLNHRLLLAEQVMSQPKMFIYRLGGLFGKERIFAKYFVNRVCTTGGQPANFIHVDDVVTLIVKGFEAELNYQVYNLVTPEHPSKKEVILASASKYGFAYPSEFKPKDSFQKIVDGFRIIKELNYNFIYRTPIDF